MKARTSVELRDPIHGAIGVDLREMQVIDAPLFQRLRGIRQLGFAELVYPGAVHNRYLHSVGAMHLAGRAFDSVFKEADWLSREQKERFRQIVRLAGLLHDIGHAPLSHAAESLMPMRNTLGLEAYGVGTGQASHEEMGLKLLVDSPLTQSLDEAFASMGISSTHVATVLGTFSSNCEEDFVVDGIDHRPVLHSLVSGELDIDRMDYLLRDSYFTGVSYGRYDLTWLLSNLQLYIDAERKARLAFGIKALPTFEHFLLARYHMFQMVYFHPKSDIYDAMLRRWLEDEGDSVRFPSDPDAYVALNDAWLMNRLRESNNPWARRVQEQTPYRLVCELRTHEQKKQRDSIDGAMKAAGIDVLWLRAAHVLSRYAQSPAKLARNPIYVHDTLGPGERMTMRIDAATDLFDRYEKNQTIERLYVTPEQRDAALAILAQTK